MKRAPERIETSRLLLRRPIPEDIEPIFARYAADAEVARYLAWPRHESVEDTRQFLVFSDSEWARGPAGPYLIEDRETGKLLGSTGINCSRHGIAVTGYVLARDAWRHGYATEALREMVALAADLGSVEVRALCHPNNAASIRVLEKCGFVRAGVVKELFPNLDRKRPLECLRFIRSLGS